MFKSIRGTRDILPQEYKIWQEVERKSAQIFELFGYQRIEIPIIENKNLFLRSLGETSEVVQKQMFIIPKNEEEDIALRPEGTAGIIRAYIENNLAKTQGFSKLYYYGSMFRAERPQKGRLREFHHIGAEAIGSLSPYLDIEVIEVCNSLLNNFGINNHKIKLNSLGCKEDKAKLNTILKDKLSSRLNNLCQDCQSRYNRNILRILYCKNPEFSAIRDNLNLSETQYLCVDCLNDYKIVCAGLDLLKIPYEKNPFLVRGLDYYNQTVFEISHSALGAQDAIGAGGRYNTLIQDLGGEPTGAIGFALGVERIILTLGQDIQLPNKQLVYLIPLGEESKQISLQLISELRKAGICADTDFENKSLKASMRKANDLKARYVLIFGEDELKDNSVMLKDMTNSLQKKVSINSLITELTNTSA